MRKILERIENMLVKEFIQIFRDPRMRSIIFVVPILQSLIFGYAVTTDVKQIQMAIFDEDKTDASRKYVDGFVPPTFEKTYYLNSQNLLDLLDSGDAQVAMHIKKGFEEAINTSKTAPVQVMIDGADSNTATIIQNYIERISGLQNKHLFMNRMRKNDLSSYDSFGIELKSRAWFNQNLESRNYYVPGVVATLLTLVTLTLTSMSVVREKEMGTMEQIIVTPIKPLEFILGKTIPFILMGFVNVVGILSVAVFWFEVPLSGSLLLLLFCSCLYLLNTLGIGLFISTISATQQQAMMGAFIFYFPIILLSGFIFPIANMPQVIQLLTYLNPLRYFLIIVRGIFLKGIGLEILWPQIIVLAMMGVCVMAFSTLRFKKTLA
jgi:ABC-2 type transport system permease protein